MIAHILAAIVHIAEAAIGYALAYVAMAWWYDRGLRATRRTIAGVLLAICAERTRKPQAVRTRTPKTTPSGAAK